MIFLSSSWCCLCPSSKIVSSYAYALGEADIHLRFGLLVSSPTSSLKTRFVVSRRAWFLGCSVVAFMSPAGERRLC
jgi:hypothetical protein